MFCVVRCIDPRDTAFPMETEINNDKEKSILMKQQILVFTGFIVILAANRITADDIARFEADLSNEFVVQDDSIASTSMAKGKVFISLTQPQDSTEEATLTYDVHLQALDLNGLQTIGITDDDVTAIHMHDLKFWPDGTQNHSRDSAGTLHVLNIFGVPRGGDDQDMTFDAELGTVTGLWDDADASPSNVVAPTTKLSDSIRALMAEDLFLVVHTTEFQNGAIGGRILRVPEPALAMIPLLCLVLVCRRRVFRGTSFRMCALSFSAVLIPFGATSKLVAQDFGWSTRADLIEANSEMAVADLDGKVYVLGGYPSTRVSVRTVQVYDPSTDSWELTTPLPRPVNHPMAASVNGKLYFIGGQVSASGGGPFLDDVREYDPVTKEWTQRADMPTRRSGGVAAVIDDKIYVAGGRPSRGHDFAAYDPATDTWTELPDLPTDRNHTAGAAIDGRMYIVGGRFGAGFSSAMTNALEVYDPVTNEWSSLAPMPTVRGGLNAVAANGCLHVFGGEGSRGMFGQHEVYDPYEDKWYSLEDMPTAVHGVTGLAFLDGTIYLPGGGTRTGGSSGSRIHQVYRPEMTCGPADIHGDLNDDGRLDVGDLDLLTQAIADGEQGVQFDLNGDETIDLLDHDFWVTSIRETWFGDANLDGEFNSSDLVAVFQAGKFEQDVEASWSDGDWNGDLRFGSGDLVKAFQDGGFEKGPRAQISSVPEPSTLFGAVVALIAGFFRLRTVGGLSSCCLNQLAVNKGHHPT